MKEEWKKTTYKTNQGNTLVVMVSNFGNIKIPERMIVGAWGYRKQKERLARLTVAPNGYLRCMAGNIHRLVAEAFVERGDTNIPLVVNHIDGNKQNNHYTNLEWVTQSSNCNHYYTSLKAVEMGRINPIEVRDMDDNLVGYFCSQVQVAKQLNLHKSAITQVLQGKNKTTGGYKLRKLTKEEYYACSKESL